MLSNNGRVSRLGAFAAAVVAIAGLSASVAHAEIITHTTFMDGPTEFPANASPGTGFAQIDIDTIALTMRVRATFTGLLGTTTVCHIHAATLVPFAGTSGVATPTPTFPGFPAGVSSGSYDQTFDMTLASSYNAAYVTANGGTVASARAALFTAMSNGTAYFNVHSTSFGGGEIRGFLPTPGSAALLGLAGLCATRRRRTA